MGVLDRAGSRFYIFGRHFPVLFKRAMMLELILALSCTFFAVFPVWGATVIVQTPQSATQGLPCAGTRAGSSLGCQANAFTAVAKFSATPGTPPICITGSTFEFLVDLALSGSKTDKYDVGFFVGETQNSPELYDGTKTCSVATFPMTPLPYYQDLGNPGNVCGDYTSDGDSIITINKIRVICAGDPTGVLAVPYTITWGVSKTAACTGPLDLLGTIGPQCHSGTSTVSGNVQVYSGAYVDVTKQTTPDGDGQPFSFTATGPAGSRVIALTGATLSSSSAVGGTYTPAASATATNSTTITLSDGQTARFYINALSTNQTLTITESATTNWENTAAISCSSTTGTTVTPNNAARSIAAILNTTNSAASCTLTNTKRSRITLVKNVGARIDATDQFTVSASGGGTLIGTTSATTAGAAATATTTFYSTPATALTLTDAKAAGPTVLGSYDSKFTCTNAFAGPGASPNASLPNNLGTTGTSITPAPGDDITCTFVNLARPTVAKNFAAANLIAGGNTNLTVTIGNINSSAITLTSAFTDNFPVGMTIGTAGNTGTCAAVTATAGAGSFTIANGTSIQSGGCTVIVNVTSSTGGPATNTIAIGALRTSAGNNAAAGSATLNVRAPPTIAAIFGPATIDVYDTSILTFTLTSPNSINLTNINFADTLTGFYVRSATIGGSCAGVTNSPALVVGATALNLSIPTLSPGSCTITIQVTASLPGSYSNTTSGATSTETGATAGAASNSANLTVNRLPLQLTKVSDVVQSGPGSTINYTIGYTNPNVSTHFQNVVITDPVPLFTTFLSASCVSLPATITSCTIAAPAVGGTGTVTWTLGGTLDAGSSGNVKLSVKVK